MARKIYDKGVGFFLYGQSQYGLDYGSHRSHRALRLFLRHRNGLFVSQPHPAEEPGLRWQPAGPAGLRPLGELR